MTVRILHKPIVSCFCLPDDDNFLDPQLFGQFDLCHLPPVVHHLRILVLLELEPERSKVERRLSPPHIQRCPDDSSEQRRLAQYGDS